MKIINWKSHELGTLPRFERVLEFCISMSKVRKLQMKIKRERVCVSVSVFLAELHSWRVNQVIMVCYKMLCCSL